MRLATAHIVGLILSTAIACVLTGCGGKTAHQETTAPVLNGAIPFPNDKATSALTDYILPGNVTDSRSTGATDQGTSLAIAAETGKSEYAVYRFNPGTNVLNDVTVTLDSQAATAAWIGIANFVTGRWEFSGPFSLEQVVALDGSKHVSPLGNIFVAVLVTSGESAKVDELKLSAENSAPVAALTATPDIGDPPLNVLLDASGSTDPNHNIVKYEWDLDGDGVFETDTGTVATVQHEFDKPGPNPVCVRVTDAGGEISTAQVRLIVHGMDIVTVDGVHEGLWTSLAVVDGNPAISCLADGATGGLMYYRSTSADGGLESDWSQRVKVAPAGYNSCLQVVNGNPAIAFDVYVTDPTTTSALRFVRASTSTGSAAADWGQPVTIDSWTPASYPDISLAVVEGNPAISYFSLPDSVHPCLKYARALDPNGDSWAAPVTVDNSGNADSCSTLLVVDGYPAISYSAAGQLKFVRAADADGSTWESPVDVASGSECSAATINGFPAISYRGGLNSDLHYVRAIDVDGNTWGTPVEITAVGAVGSNGGYKSLREINGRPAISCIHWNAPDAYLLYVQATTSTGGAVADWSPVDQVSDVGTSGDYACLAEVEGQPAISFCYWPAAPDNGALRFAITF